MTRISVLAVALLVAALGAGGGGATPAQTPKLHAKVGPGFFITLTDDAGRRVTNLDPGTYEIEVEDEGTEHNFRLRGPGVNRATDIGGTGKELWTVNLVQGTYTYFCDPHQSTMRGSFTVGTPPATSPPPRNVVTPRSRLVLTSGPGFTITLRTAAGKAVRTMKRGTYSFTVRDRSRLHNAHVVAPGANRKTGVGYVGTQRWRLRLVRTGTLRFLCDPHASQGMRGSARIVR